MTKFYPLKLGQDENLNKNKRTKVRKKPSAKAG